MLNINLVQKYFDEKCIISDVSLSLPKGQIGCLLGASGCGKTTLLRTIAGFENINGGEIKINDTVVSSKTTFVPPEDRKVGMVFQDYALFPHLTVIENIAFGLQNKKQRFFSSSRSHSTQQRIDEMLNLVGLEDSAKKYPHQLSGGQQQRVALARALAPKPQLLLMDEPFSNLDVTLREHLSVEMRSILKKEDITAVMVTHNQNEAFAMGDIVGIMNDGILHQWDTPKNIYHTPTTPFVSTFVGEGVLIKGEFSDNTVCTALGTFEKASITFFHSLNEGCMLVRPEKILISPTYSKAKIQATIEEVIFKGTHSSCSLRLASNETIIAHISNNSRLSKGSTVSICYSLEH